MVKKRKEPITIEDVLVFARQLKGKSEIDIIKDEGFVMVGIPRANMDASTRKVLEAINQYNHRLKTKIWEKT
jgi:hypothetical protein